MILYSNVLYKLYILKGCNVTRLSHTAVSIYLCIHPYIYLSISMSNVYICPSFFKAAVTKSNEADRSISEQMAETKVLLISFFSFILNWLVFLYLPLYIILYIYTYIVIFFYSFLFLWVFISKSKMIMFFF